MFWMIAYAVLVVYAAGLFCYAATRGRDGAALGILITLTGMQLAVMQTVSVSLGVALAVAGAALAAYDIVTVAVRRLSPRAVILRSRDALSR